MLNFMNTLVISTMLNNYVHAPIIEGDLLTGIKTRTSMKLVSFKNQHATLTVEL